MNRRMLTPLAVLAALAWSAPAATSGCCYEQPQWKLGTTLFTGYGNSAMLVPGNDSRVNLLLLLADERPPGSLTAPSSSAGASLATPLFQWHPFRNSLFGEPEPSGEGSRCQSNAAGAQAFTAAIAADRKVPEGERAALIDWRRQFAPLCEGGGLAAPPSPASAAGRAFARYLEGARAFYTGDFPSAASKFGGLRSASNPWVRETALYMEGRTALNRAQADAIDEYGSLKPPGAAGPTLPLAAEAALLSYLKAYPAGRYSASARGLLRRVYWLAGDKRKLGEEYRALAARDPAGRGINEADLVQEMDYKYLPELRAGDAADPRVAATLALMGMRGSSGDSDAYPRITRAEIEAQRASFGQNQALFGYVRAAHAYFVAGKPSEVLALIPDEARQRRFSYLQFSRQMLRGLALDATGDRNARGFWLEMLTGATQPYQRQALELALAMHEERNGGLSRVFASGSPISDPGIRDILLTYSVGPDLLRQVARSDTLPRRERDAALFMLLYKQLSRGRYTAFLQDLKLVRPGASADTSYMSWLNYRDIDYPADAAPPLGLFTQPSGLGDFGCPSLAATAAALAAAPRLSGPRLCVAEFIRAGGFDGFAADTPMPKDELGGGPTQFPGQPYARLEVYKDVIADPKAPATDKAYALYRAVYCYAPGGSNDCGGVDVEKGQRRAWFLRLKRDYPTSRWAKALKYYW